MLLSQSKRRTRFKYNLRYTGIPTYVALCPFHNVVIRLSNDPRPSSCPMCSCCSTQQWWYSYIGKVGIMSDMLFGKKLILVDGIRYYAQVFKPPNRIYFYRQHIKTSTSDTKIDRVNKEIAKLQNKKHPLTEEEEYDLSILESQASYLEVINEEKKTIKTTTKKKRANLTKKVITIMEQQGYKVSIVDSDKVTHALTLMKRFLTNKGKKCKPLSTLSYGSSHIPTQIDIQNALNIRHKESSLKLLLNSNITKTRIQSSDKTDNHKTKTNIVQLNTLNKETIELYRLLGNA